jgi:hypothetical protein
MKPELKDGERINVMTTEEADKLMEHIKLQCGNKCPGGSFPTQSCWCCDGLTDIQEILDYLTFY